MSVQNTGPLPDPNAPNNPSTNTSQPNFERWGAWTAGAGAEAKTNNEQTQPLRAVNNPASTPASATPREQDGLPIDPQFTHREHVTGMLPVPVHPEDAPQFRPAYMPYPGNGQAPAPSPPAGAWPPQAQHGPGNVYGGYGLLQAPVLPPPPGQVYPPYQPQPQQGPPYQQYPGYGHSYPYPPANGAYPYPGYGYPYPYPYPYAPYWQPQPKRDGYRHAVAIVALICSILAILGGIGSVLFFLILAIVPHSPIAESNYLSSLMTFAAFGISGIVGGGFSLYHSIRGLLRKPSANIILPWFWIFLVLYLLVIAVGYALLANGLEVQNLALTIFLIILSAIFPALALAAFGVRRLRFPRWPTTWRRFTLAITSGATLGIGLALLLELGLLILVLRSQATNFDQYLTSPNTPSNNSFGMFALIFLVVAIIGPLVEETVKPLGVAFYIGRMRSAAEAFTLGMAAGIGFALVETVGYIGSGYQDWLAVALERTAASLLHGFGAAMVALGWYYLTHAKHHPKRKAFGCWAYAVFQHLVWNGTAVLAFLPAPAGPALNNLNINLGFTELPLLELLNILEAILILVFFVYMTGRLRRQTPPTDDADPRQEPLHRPGEPAMAKA